MKALEMEFCPDRLEWRVKVSAMRRCFRATHWPLRVCSVALLSNFRLHGAASYGPLPPVGRPVMLLATGPDPLELGGI